MIKEYDFVCNGEKNGKNNTVRRCMGSYDPAPKIGQALFDEKDGYVEMMCPYIRDENAMIFKYRVETPVGKGMQYTFDQQEAKEILEELRKVDNGEYGPTILQ